MDVSLYSLLTFLICLAFSKGAFRTYYNYASCDMVPGVDPGLSGKVYMRQRVPTRQMYGMYSQYYPLEIYVNMQVTKSDYTTGIKEHGIHVHTFGDLSGNCSGAGGHYNPMSTDHGAPSDPFDKRHIGDWGNIKEVNGTLKTRFLDYLAPLYGPYSIYGRAIVLHEKADDLGRGGNEGSTASGNAGKRFGCCVIRHMGNKDF